MHQLIIILLNHHLSQVTSLMGGTPRVGERILRVNNIDVHLWSLRQVRASPDQRSIPIALEYIRLEQRENSNHTHARS